MKIFISYGHDDHTALVNAVYDALLEAGHEPWKDDRYEGHSGIAAGKDFTRVIYRAIQESDFVLAFATNKTMEKPYCCDERQYAYNAKGRRFIQLRLDGVDIQLGNAGSYIDMDAVEESTGRINQKLLQEKLQAVYAAFRAPENLLSPNAKYERYLKIKGTVPYEEFITMPETDDFVGREWLKEQCKAWALDASIPCRLFVILGEAGSGKTAFVRHLSEDKELVRSVHVCIFDRPKTRSINETLKNLAFTLTQNNYRYSDFLKNKDFEQLADLDYAGLFEFLFIEPLKNETEKYLLIIDGLDELEETTGLNPLIQLLRQYAGKINPNISILVTGRPDENIINKLKTVSRGKTDQRVLLSRENGQDDLNEFIRRKLTELGCHTDALQQRIFEACDGNFEYLTLLFREAFEEGLELTGDMVLPRGLQERYTQYLDRRMEKNDQDEALTKEQYRLLSVLAVAYEPMPRSLLAEITGYDAFDVNRELKVFGSLIRQTAAPDNDRMISFFSKGFRDYLLSGEYDNYAVSAAEGTQALADYVMKHCTTEAAFARIPYLDRYGFTHLLLSIRKNKAAAEAYLDRMKQADMDRTMRRIASALCTGEQAAVEVFFSEKREEDADHAVVSQLKGRRALDTLMTVANVYENQGCLDKALVLRADILMMNPSDHTVSTAQELYNQAREIMERRYAANPDYSTRKRMAIIYERLGKTHQSQSAADSWIQAEAWYQKELVLTQQNYQEHPCYESRRALSVNCYKLCLICRGKSTPESMEEAEAWIRKALALDEENLRENPCYESRYDLSATAECLGNIFLKKATPENLAIAETFYRQSMTLIEQNYQENPCYESRNSLVITYDWLGVICQSKATPAGLEEAEAWYQKELAMAEQNYREAPCYDSRCCLNVTYERLGDVCRSKATPESMEEAEAWYQKELMMAEQNHRENPCYDSRASLIVTCVRLGDICESKDSPEGLEEAKAWYQKAQTLAEQNHRESPCYDSRRELSCTYGRLGAICQSNATPEESAEAWYQKKLALDEENYREYPCYESRRGLSITYAWLGDIGRSKATSEGLQEAEALHQKGMALDEENYREYPCYESRRNLSIAYERIGDICEIKAASEGGKEAEAWYQKALALCEDNYLNNPCYESRRDLGFCCSRLGDFNFGSGTPSTLEAAAVWYAKTLALFEENLAQYPCEQSQNDVEMIRQILQDVQTSLSSLSDA